MVLVATSNAVNILVVNSADASMYSKPSWYEITTTTTTEETESEESEESEEEDTEEVEE